MDDYRIVQVLGAGGFGTTYRAVDERLERVVAIKEYLPASFAERRADGTVAPRAGSDPGMFAWGLQRFVEEGRTLARFRHPNLGSVLRFVEARQTAYLVMEYEAGTCLDVWAREHGRGLTEARLVGELLDPLLDGLARIHAEGLLHRDIKPQNIIIRPDGSPVLIDFGASRVAGAPGSNATFLVSTGYSPLEQYGSGGAPQGPWSDIYALCGTAYHVIAGRVPVDAIARVQGRDLEPAVVAGRGRFSDALLRALDGGLEMEPAERPQTVDELRGLLGLAPTRHRPRNDAPPSEIPLTRLPSAPSRSSELGDPLVEHDAKLEASRARRLSSLSRTALAGGLLALSVGGGAWAWQLASVAVEGPIRQVESRVPEAERADARAAAAIVEGAQQPSEDQLLRGLALPDDVKRFRSDQLAGALLAYAQTKQAFAACLREGCATQQQLVASVQAALQGDAWERGSYSGTIRLRNPRRLARADCMFMIDVYETLRTPGAEREETRRYCTRTGFDRVLQPLESVSAPPSSNQRR